MRLFLESGVRRITVALSFCLALRIPIIAATPIATLALHNATEQKDEVNRSSAAIPDNKANWANTTMPIVVASYLLLVWIGTAIWEARKYNPEERFYKRFIRGLCCGQRRDQWHKRCRVCRKHHYCEACRESECDITGETPYIELRTMGPDGGERR